MRDDITNYRRYTISTMLVCIYTILIVGIITTIFKIKNQDMIINILVLISVIAMPVAAILGRIKDRKEEDRKS